MSDADDARAVTSPETEASALAEIAARRPDLGAQIAAHPHAYEALLDWLASYGDDAAQAAVLRRRNEEVADGETSAPPALPASPTPSSPDLDVAAVVHRETPVEAMDESETPTAPSRPARRGWLIAAVAAVAILVIAAIAVPLLVQSRASAERARAIELSVQVVDATGSPVEDVGLRVSSPDEGQIGADATDGSGYTTFHYAHGATFVVALTTNTLPDGMRIDDASASQTVTIDDGGTDTVTFTVERDDPTPTPTPTPTPSETTDPAVTWVFTTDSGYTYSETFNISEPTASGSNGSRRVNSDDDSAFPETTPNTIGSACTDFDPDRDIAVPVTMTVVAHTPGFDTPVHASYAIGTRTSWDDDPPAGLSTIDIESEHFYTADTDCKSWGAGGINSAGVQWTDPVSNGDSVTDHFTVIIKNYRSPNAPNGDTALLDWITITPVGATTDEAGVGSYQKTSGPSSITLTGRGVE